MNEKLLLSENRNAVKHFEAEINDVIERTQSLITIFETLQPFRKVTSTEDLTTLLANPAEFYDQTLIANSTIQAGRLKPDVSQLALLFGLHRAEYLNIVAGIPLKTDSCIPCRSVKVTPGKKAISLAVYQQFEDYVLFDNGTVYPNVEAIKQKTDSFRIYAESDEAVELLTFWQGVCKTVNELHKKGYVGGQLLQDLLSKTNGILRFNYVAMEVWLDTDNLVNEVLKLQSINI